LLNSIEAGRLLYVPLIVLGELFSGVYRGSQRAKAQNQIQGFLPMTVIIHPNETTADYYG
jgi:hypothetical protein